jgi:acyl dehydratase
MAIDQMTGTLEFHDIEPGFTQHAGPYLVTEADIVEFATRWDPRPIHIDKAAATVGPFNGLTASSSHTLAIRTRLLFEIVPPFPSLVATMGWQDLKLPKPVRPGNELSLALTWLDKRTSKSNPALGILRQRIVITNQHGDVVLDYVDTVGMRIVAAGDR